MPGYLDTYGAGEERRNRIIKRILLSLVTLIVGGAILTFVFYDFRQERQVKRFFAALQARDYKSAYAYWCPPAKPCPGYPMDAFLEDWGGAKSKHPSVTDFNITRSRTCGSGVIITVELPQDQLERLWVDRQNLLVGFSPFPTSNCPANVR